MLYYHGARWAPKDMDIYVSHDGWRPLVEAFLAEGWRLDIDALFRRLGRSEEDNATHTVPASDDQPANDDVYPASFEETGVKSKVTL